MEQYAKTLEADLQQRAVRARSDIRNVERFAYRIVSDAVSAKEVTEAAAILRLTVGLRRKLDMWKKFTS